MDEPTKSKTQTQKDYYYILGVRPDATGREIQAAYEQLYEKFGPHVNVSGMDPDLMIKTFKDICDAYEVLMDPMKRKEYDKNTSHLRQSMGDLRALWQSKAAAGDTGAHPKVSALALEMECEITLKEAIKGCTKQFRISDPRPCEECSAQRAASRMQCPNCRGLGYVNVERVDDVELPPGMYDGLEIRRPGSGRYDMRAARHGDLIIKIKLLPHPFLGILGRDITCTVPVTIYEAVLGAEIDIPTATGKAVMKIQPLTQPGRVYRLKGLGLAGADQLVTVDVVFPQKLSPEEVSLFRRLKEASQDPNPRDALFSRMHQ
ncbi:MAG TPA: DnaJ C-terminal domain-containing protein [Candidatus Obscuribacterales bacterium]